MAQADWNEIRTLIDLCKKGGGRELCLSFATDEIGHDPLLLDEVLHIVRQDVPGVESLALNIDGEGATIAVLAKHAKHLPKLRSLTLDVVGDEAVVALATALHVLPPVVELELGAIGDQGLEALAAELRHLSKVQTIGFCGCTFGDAGLRALGRRAQHLRSLEKLEMEELIDRVPPPPKATSKGYAALLRGLTGNKVLDLSCWPVDDLSLKALARQGKALARLELLNIASADVSDDGVVALAAQAQHLDSLQSLFLHGTQVGDDGLKALALASRAGNLRCLERLFVKNTHVSLPDELISAGEAGPIFEYFLNREAQEQQPLRRVKLLLVGQGRVGKTHLRMRLFTEDDVVEEYFCPTEPETYDISMHRWQPAQEGEGAIQYDVWDFGGQDHLHGTHRFFLGADHCLYLLTLDATRSDVDNRLDYWLRFLAHHGLSKKKDESGGELRAPVIIILNKCDDVTLADAGDYPFEINAAAVRKNHADLKSALDIARKSDWYGANVVAGPIEGLGWSTAAEQHRLHVQVKENHDKALADIRAAVDNATESIVGWSLPYSTGFHDLLSWIESQFHEAESHQPVKWIKYTSHPFQSAFENAQIESGGLQKTHLELLNSLGVVHWVGGIPEVERGTDTLAKEAVFNPHWVKGPVYRVIRTPADQHERGWIRQDRLNGLLELDNDEQRDAIRRLMTACKLAFEVEERPDLSNGLLVPDLLEPLKQAEFAHWEGDDVLRDCLRLPFLPEQAFLKFVAKHYGKIARPKKECYRNEVVLTLSDRRCESLVQIELAPKPGEEPHLSIAIRGPAPDMRLQEHILVKNVVNEALVAEGVAGKWEQECRSGTATSSKQAPKEESRFRGHGQSAKRRTGRPKRTEKDSATKVVAALSKHHGYESDGSVTNYEPASNRGLAELFNLSPNALSRFLESRGGHKKYEIQCRNRKLGLLLASWRGELLDQHHNLRPDEPLGENE